MSALELPWQIKVDGFGYPSIYGTNENGGQGVLVAHTFADHEHLIRSAPQLLAALQEARRALMHHEWFANPACGWARSESKSLRTQVDAALESAAPAKQVLA